MKPDFMRGKRVLVTGASRGIGEGIARSFSEAGAELILHYRTDPERAKKLADGLGGKIHLFRADLGKTEELSAMFEWIGKEFGSLDCAVNNAGWDPGFIAWEDITPELYYKLTDMNVKGTLFCCLNELRLMKKNGGSILNIGSVQQDTTVPGRTLYALSKGAVHSMTAQLALEGGPLGIRVNNILPGYIDVPRMHTTPEIAKGIPVRRIGQGGDIGALCVFLASEDASFINGADIPVDGGVSCKLARDSR
ncbi:MAG: Glucose 1-dehydrogenase 2 [Lentisphaerae bacterium ADurb.Bin242]|nr:MAG: Glucose 1-dehydrogenase 2 [Lentisphaerae bacterium ADurb.Bin242]